MELVELHYDPLKLIFQQGDEVTKLHLLQFLNLLETGKAKDLILYLLKSQTSSGGFPSRFNGEIEGVEETCRTALLLLKCGLPADKLNIQAAISFLLKNQNEDGGWSENSSLSIPEEVGWISTTKSITWLTADITFLFHCVGLGKSESCVKALNWLKKMQNKEGGWPMFKSNQVSRTDPDSTTQILFLMKEFQGINKLIWEKGIKLFEKFLDNLALDAERGYFITPTGERRSNDIYHLTYLLLSSLVDPGGRIEAGYDLSDIRIKKIVRAIIDSQGKDGGWTPFWAQSSDPTYTVLTLKLLILLDVLNSESLRKKVKAYV